jgi:hypothetical protein
MASEKDYHLASEKDVSGKANRQIWIYFIVLGVSLYLTILGLDILYRFQLDYQLDIKVSEVTTPETMEETTRAEGILSGKNGLLEGKRHVSIDSALTSFLMLLRQAR